MRAARTRRRVSRGARVAALAGSVWLSACGAPTAERTAVGGDETAAPVRAGSLPGVLSTGRGDGPALFLSSDTNAPAFGFLGEGVRVDLLSGIENGRVRVQTAGPLTARGYLPLERLAARALRRGRVQGTPAYVAPGNVLGVRGVEGEWLTVWVQPSSRRLEQIGVRLPAFTGRFPLALVSGGVGELAAEPPRPGFRVALPEDAPTEVFDQPGGARIATLPPLTPPLEAALLKDGADWKGIRVGDGPYLVGFVSTKLTRVSEAAPPAAEPEAPVGTQGLPSRLRVDADKPLWRVRGGSKVRFGDVTVAKLEEAAYARELARLPSGEVDVFLAVDEAVALRGAVREEDLEALTPPPNAGPDRGRGVLDAEPPAASPSGEPPPAESL